MEGLLIVIGVIVVLLVFFIPQFKSQFKSMGEMRRFRHRKTLDQLRREADGEEIPAEELEPKKRIKLSR